MGLIRCDQCGYDVSTEATNCPHCHTPIVLFQLKHSLSRKKEQTKNISSTKTPEEPSQNVISEEKRQSPEINNKTSPNIFDTIKTFKEKQSLLDKDKPDQEKENKDTAEIHHEHEHLGGVYKQSEIRDRLDDQSEQEATKSTPAHSDILSAAQTDINIHNNQAISKDKSTSIKHGEESKMEQAQNNSPQIPQQKSPTPDHATQTVHPVTTHTKPLYSNDSSKTIRTQGSNSKYILLLVVVAALAGLGFFFSNKSDSPKTPADEQKEKSEHFNKNRQKIVDEINKQLNLNNYGNAQEIAREYLYINDKEINNMYIKARTEYLTIELNKLPTHWDNYTLPKAIKSNDSEIKLYLDIKQLYREKRRIYEELIKIDPSNAEFKEKYQYFSKKYDELNNKFAELSNKRAEEMKRKEKIDLQFSRIDGSHINLETYIKNKMKYPDSFVHIKSIYEDRESYLIVATTYQGKDTYEQVVIKTVKARVGLDGKVQRIIGEY